MLASEEQFICFVLVVCFFFFPKPSFACISITDEIAGVMRDELPEAQFVAAADNIVDSSWKGEGDQSVGLLRSLPPAATERLSELTLLLPELPGGDYSFSEVGTPPLHR